MMQAQQPLLLCCWCLFFFLILLHGNEASRQSIGAIMDCGSRSGREERLAMEMATEDFHNLTGRRLALHVRCSRHDPVRAASDAMGLINEQHVQAIIVAQTWKESSFIAELGEKAQVPILSLANASPSLASRRWPYLVQIAHNQEMQMSAVAAIVRSWHWRRVSIIYEDVDYTAPGIIPHLANALRNEGSEIDYRLALNSFSTSFAEELDILRGRQCRVFVIHSSMPLAARLFAEAKQMGMMAKEYVWIATDGITSLLDTTNSSVLTSMQGILGVKNYFHPSAKIQDFNARFQRKLRLIYPEEDTAELQPSATLSYDAVWAVANAMERTGSSVMFQNHKRHGFMENSNDALPLLVYKDGLSLLQAILQTNFTGLSGEFHFVDGELSQPKIFEIVNVVGKSYRELGFWSFETGFSEGAYNSQDYGTSMNIFGQIFWPGGPLSVPRGWSPPTSEEPLKIAVPARAVFPDFVHVKYVNHNETTVEGFSIDVFKETVKHLPYHLPYRFIPYNGTYGTLVEHDQMKSFDILVGDTSISSGRYHYVEFSQPYTPSGLVMVVPAASTRIEMAWIFLKPFTASMWALTALVSMYNGLVVWLIERKCNSEFQGTLWNQIGALFWLSFTTLLSPGEKLHSNLSRAAMVVWLFAALVLTSNYTASLSSMLTARRLEPNLVKMEALKSNGAKVGCNHGSVVSKYLEEVLGFHPKNIKLYTMEDDYYQALQKGEIKAAFLRIPHAHLFLAKYCNEFTTTGPVYHVGGLGFVFPKGSPLLSDISQALLQVFERGTIQKLEKAMYDSYNCSRQRWDAAEFDRLSPGSFWGLFMLTVFASTIVLMIYGLFLHRNIWEPNGGPQVAPDPKDSKV